MSNIIQLRPERIHTEIRDKALPGFLYQLDRNTPEALENSDYFQQSGGLIAAYRLSVDAGIIERIDTTAQCIKGFVWDNDLLSSCMQQDLKIRNQSWFSRHCNRLTLLESGLQGPEINVLDHQPVLNVSPYFKMQWHTEAFASQLGCIQLVEASRRLQFENGESLDLLDTESAESSSVLYLMNSSDKLAVKPVCDFQQLGIDQQVNFTTAITQTIPVQLGDKTIVSLTVLEKYSCYFMQNAAPNDPEQHIWTPVHLPITWGWSIRVQQRFDGVWDIFRKKLILPASSTELPPLPVWQGNSLRNNQGI